jgi:hypothetical protein
LEEIKFESEESVKMRKVSYISLLGLSSSLVEGISNSKGGDWLVVRIILEQELSWGDLMAMAQGFNSEGGSLESVVGL